MNYTVTIQLSRRLAVVLIVVHGTAVALLWPLALPGWIKWLLAAALFASLVFHVRRDVRLSAPQSIVGFDVGEDGASLLHTRSGNTIEARLLPDSFVTPYLCVLGFKPAGRRYARHVTLLSDSLGADEFRRLRVWLKWKVAFAEKKETPMLQ
ncbi:MAG: protein YgfX [Pseudomonadota bacterium]